MNANAIPVAELTAYMELYHGVARLLAGQAPAPPSSLSLPRLYLIVDAVLAVLFAVALWPLLRLQRWEQRLRQQHRGRWRVLRIGLRLVWEFGVPLTLLMGARLLLHDIGAQSWGEGLVAFPDFTMWLWAIALVMLLTGATRLVLLRRVLRRTGGERGMVPSAPPSRRPE